ncbi:MULTISPECIES: hypothetical protein [unclassified Bradyrhizobium]
MRTPVGCFHDARAATGHYQEAAADGLFACGTDDLSELARDSVILAVRRNTPCRLETALQTVVVGIQCQRISYRGDGPARRRRLANASAAKDDDRMSDLMLSQQGFGLEKIKLEANAACGFALQEIFVLIRLLIA